MSEAPTPPGWPEQVPGAGTPGWEQHAVAWLLDVGPSWLRHREPLWRQHPRLLARHMLKQADAQLEGLRRAYSTARVDLREAEMEPHVVDQLLGAYVAEGQRLRQLQRQVQFLVDGLSGVRWRPGLQAPPWAEGDPDFQRARGERR